MTFRTTRQERKASGERSSTKGRQEEREEKARSGERRDEKWLTYGSGGGETDNEKAGEAGDKQGLVGD